MSLEGVEKDEGIGESTGFSLELMGNNFMVVQIPMLADGKRK
jgi:hypothetical protein